MADTIISFEEVSEYLHTETRRAFAAARTIPIRATKVGFKFLMDESPVFSGAYRACNAIGVNELPEIDVTIAAPGAGGQGRSKKTGRFTAGSDSLINLSDAIRFYLHRTGQPLEFSGPWQDTSVLDKDFELGDEILIGNEIRYAERVEEEKGLLISARTRQVVEVELERLADDFNRRSDAATFGAGGDVVE